MKHNRFLLLVAILLTTLLMPANALADLITARDFTAQQVPDLQSQTTNTILVDKDGFIWISNRNGIDRYDGLNTHHYKIGDPGKRGYREGMMILMHRDHKGRIWAFTERGVVYCFNEMADRFDTKADLYAHQKWVSVQALFVTEDEHLVLGTNEGIITYDLEKDEVLSHEAQDCSVRCFTMYGKEKLMVGSESGMFMYDHIKEHVDSQLLNTLPVICLEPVGNYLWVGTRGKGLHVMPRNDISGLKEIEDTDNLIINGLAYAENYGLLIGCDGEGLIQLDLDIETGKPKSELHRVAYDNKNAIFPTRSGGIFDVLVNHGNVWISMSMGGCMRLIPNHNMVTLTNPDAESPSDNFVYDLDKGPDGDLWIAYNQAIVRYKAKTHEPTIYMNRESRFLSLKVMPDSTIWAGGYGTGLYHFNPETGEKEWFSSVADAPVNDNIYDIHNSPDGDLWVGGLNFPLTRLHFLPDGSFTKTNYKELIQVFDIESLNKDTLVLAGSDGFWLLDVNTNQISHHLEVGDEYEWQGCNLVRSIMTRGSEIWVATAGAGLVCYDISTRRYEYFDNLDLLPSLELRSVVMLNDSILCISTEDTGVFSFNCNTRRTERSLLQEDEMLKQEFLQNSGIRFENGGIMFGGDQGGIMLTHKDIIEDLLVYKIFILGPKQENNDYAISYRHNNLTIGFCTNDVYHQDDYQFSYRIEGWSDNWLPTTHPRSLTLVNLPPGDWDLELRAINSTHLEIPEVLHLHVSRPIWQRWYAWVAYIMFFFWIVLKIVLYLLRPRIEDM